MMSLLRSGNLLRRSCSSHSALLRTPVAFVHGQPSPFGETNCAILPKRVVNLLYPASSFDPDPKKRLSNNLNMQNNFLRVQPRDYLDLLRAAVFQQDQLTQKERMQEATRRMEKSELPPHAQGRESSTASAGFEFVPSAAYRSKVPRVRPSAAKLARLRSLVRSSS